MFERIKSLPKYIFGFDVTGTVTSEDYSSILEPALEEAHRNGQKISCLVRFGESFDGFTPGAMWSDFKIGIQYMNLITKGALVTDSEWIKKIGGFARPFIPMPLKIFSLDEYESALKWLKLVEKPHVHYRFDRKKGLLQVKVTEKLNQADFTKLGAAIDPWVEEHGALKGMMISAPSFPGWEDFGSLIKHLKFVSGHHKNIGRVAIVADGVTANSLPTLANHFVHSNIKHFEQGDWEKAMDFLDQ